MCVGELQKCSCPRGPVHFGPVQSFRMAKERKLSWLSGGQTKRFHEQRAQCVGLHHCSQGAMVKWRKTGAHRLGAILFACESRS